MNTANLTSKRVLLPTVAAVAAFGAGGVVWAATANADLAANERDRVGAAATEAVGGGTVVDAETSDDLGEAYEVEVRKADGTEVEVDLDENLGVVSQHIDDDDDDWDDDDDRDDDRDGDDRVLSASEMSSAEEAALTAVDGGTVIEVEASDDRDEAYEVDVLDADRIVWEVELDADFTVLRKFPDD